MLLPLLTFDLGSLELFHTLKVFPFLLHLQICIKYSLLLFSMEPMKNIYQKS